MRLYFDEIGRVRLLTAKQEATIGRRFGLTRERIRQIEAHALVKLRQPGLGLRHLIES